MAWNILSTFVAYQRLTAAVMESIRENLNILKSPQVAISNVTKAADTTTTSTNFTDVDTTWYQVTLTPSIASGTCSIRVWATLSCKPSITASQQVTRFDLMIDGVSVSGTTGINVVEGNQNQIYPVTIEWLITGVAPGAHTIKLRWRTNGGTTTIPGYSASTPRVGQAQFGAMEI